MQNEKTVEFMMDAERRYMVTLRNSGAHSVQFAHTPQLVHPAPVTPSDVDPDTQEWRNAVAQALFLSGETSRPEE